MPLILAPVGLLGMQHGDGEILACRAAQAAGIPVHAEHDVDLFDRGYRGHRRQAVLVPALRDEGPRLHQGADRARDRGEMQRAGADRRPAGDRAAPSGHQERHDGAAGMVAVEIARLRQQAGLGRRRAARQAPHLRQPGRPSQGHRGYHRALDLDRFAVRHHAELEGCRLDPQHLAGQADPQGHSRRRGRRGSRQERRAGAGGLQPWRPAARRRAVVDRGAARDRRCRRLADGDHVRRRHSLRPGRDARARARRQILHDRPRLSSTGSAPAARPASPRRSTSSPRSSTTTMGLCGVNTIAEIDDHVLAV